MLIEELLFVYLVELVDAMTAALHGNSACCHPEEAMHNIP